MSHRACCAELSHQRLQQQVMDFAAQQDCWQCWQCWYAACCKCNVSCQMLHGFGHHCTVHKVLQYCCRASSDRLQTIRAGHAAAEQEHLHSQPLSAAQVPVQPPRET